MENNFYNKPLEELSPEQSWEKLLFYQREDVKGGFLVPKLMQKAIDLILAKQYNKKVYAINYGHSMLKLVGSNKWSLGQAELDILDQESRYVTGDKFSTDYLITFYPKESEDIAGKRVKEFNKRVQEIGLDEATKEAGEKNDRLVVKKEFNESELESVLDEFIGKLLQLK